jgi:hypothetical protein
MERSFMITLFSSIVILTFVSVSSSQYTATKLTTNSYDVGWL